MREKRGKAHEASTVNFGVLNALYELSIYRESSQLISEKFWEQVIHILDICTKLSQIEYPNISY